MLTDNTAAPLILAIADDNIHTRKRRHSFEKAPEEFHMDIDDTKFDDLPDLISIIDTNHTITRVNKAMAEHCCVTPKELVGLKCHEVVHNLKDSPDCCPFTDMMLDAKVHNNEIRSKSLQGIYDVMVSPLFDEEGRITEYVHVMRDMTESKLVEESRLALKDALQEQNDELLATEEMLRLQINDYETSQQRLKDSEERFKALHDGSFGGIMIHNKCHILDCNKGLSEMTGYTIEELVGMDSLKLVAPDRHDLVLQNIRSGFDQRYEVVGVRKDGTKYPLAIRGKDISYQGRTARVTEFRDITENKQIEAEKLVLEHQFHQAQKLESLGLLAGGIGHDFNNILTIILGYCYLAKECINSEQEYKAAFMEVETASNRAADLCRQMLTYAGESLLVQTRINLWLLVNEVVKMLRAAIKKNVTIEFDLQRDVSEIMGNTGQIQQIIMNLIINAAEALGDDNGIIKVLLKNKAVSSDQNETDTFGAVIQPGIYTCLEVTDTGSGMDEETQKRIFEPFYTTKITGRGLGMSAILGIVKSHDSILQMSSKPGIGTTFKVYFPVPDAADCVKTSATTSALPEKASGSILLVDDEETLRILGEITLSAQGFSVMTAANGSEALEIYRERAGEIDLILLDLIMPIMGGIETYHEVRKHNQIMPIIICSGYGVESVLEIINNDDHAEFVQKPFMPDQLRDVLTRMMG